MKPSAAERTSTLPGFAAPKVWRVKRKGGNVVHLVPAGSFLTAPALCGSEPDSMPGLARPSESWSHVVATNNAQCNACFIEGSRGRMVVEEKP